MYRQRDYLKLSDFSKLAGVPIEEVDKFFDLDLHGYFKQIGDHKFIAEDALFFFKKCSCVNDFLSLQRSCNEWRTKVQTLKKALGADDCSLELMDNQLKLLTSIIDIVADALKRSDAFAKP